MRLLKAKDVLLAVLLGYVMATLPIWIESFGRIYLGIVTTGLAMFVLIALNERDKTRGA